MHDRLPFPDAAPDLPPAEWQAAWIWHANQTEGVHDYVYFRREFALETLPDQLLLRLAAERDATLWVNGQLIAYGPPISDPRWKRYDTHDITRHLQVGSNCLAIRVYHGTGLAGFTAHADARGLLCQIECDGQVILTSDEQWRSWLAVSYGGAGQRMGDSMWIETQGANRDPKDWQLAGFDDSAWPAAARAIRPRHHLWHAEQPQARFFPWVNLIPSETKPLRRTDHLPQVILQHGEILQQRQSNLTDIAVRMSLETIRPLDKATIDNLDSLLTKEGTTTLRNSPLDEAYDSFDGLRNATIVLDFGRLMNARLGLELTAKHTTIDIAYAYRLENGRVVPYVSSRTAQADHYCARQGEQRWQTADWRHFRYVQLTFREITGSVELQRVWAEEITNHVEERGAFSCNDPELDRLFAVVRRTTQLNMTDRTMDNPSRERKQYLGDCSGIVPAITSCFGDLAILRRYFANAREGQHATGQFRYSYPGHDNDHASLFDHALAVPLRLWEHFQLFADLELVADMWPSLDRFCELAASSVGDDGMMSLPPYNIWFDWGHMDRRGHFLPLQAMTAEALRRTAELAEAIGQDGSRWATLAEQMIARIPRWYDETQGVFVDAIVDDQRQTHLSEHATSLVAAWNLAPAEMIQRTLDRWSEDPLQFGQTSPAWMYLPGAFLAAGRPELAIRWIHKRLGQLAAQDLDTWPETWCLYGERTTGTWRCRDSRAVAQGAGLGGATALLQDLCGIRPGSPGFATVHLTPQPGPLMHLSGTQPGPDGDYRLDLQRVDHGWQLELHLPSPRHVTLDACFAPDIQQATLGNDQTLTAEQVTLPNGQTGPRFSWQADAHTTVNLST